MVVLGLCGGKTGIGSTWELQQQSIWCMQGATGVHSWPEPPVLCRAVFLCFQDVSKFGGLLLGHEQMLFLLHKMRVWN